MQPSRSEDFTPYPVAVFSAIQTQVPSSCHTWPITSHRLAAVRAYEEYSIDFP